MTVEAASEWGRLLGRKERNADEEQHDATQVDDVDWKLMLGRLAESAASGTADLEAYRARFDQEFCLGAPERTTREQSTPPPASAAPTATRDHVETEPLADEAPSPRPAVATPSYLLGARAPAAPTEPLTATTASSPPLTEVDSMDVDETAPAGFVLPKDALPFAPGAPRPPDVTSRAHAEEVAGSRGAIGDENATIAPTLDAQRALLPFVERIRAEAAGANTATVELRSAPTEDVDETLPPLVNRSPALPFARGTAETPSVDETAFVSRDQVFGPATPFLKTPAAVTLEEYAAFLGELSRDPTKADQVRVRHGIKDEEAQRAIGARFAAEFARDPSLRATFDEMLAKARRLRE